MNIDPNTYIIIIIILLIVLIPILIRLISMKLKIKTDEGHMYVVFLFCIIVPIWWAYAHPEFCKDWFCNALTAWVVNISSTVTISFFVWFLFFKDDRQKLYEETKNLHDALQIRDTIPFNDIMDTHRLILERKAKHTRQIEFEATDLKAASEKSIYTLPLTLETFHFFTRDKYTYNPNSAQKQKIEKWFDHESSLRDEIRNNIRRIIIVDDNDLRHPEIYSFLDHHKEDKANTWKVITKADLETEGGRNKNLGIHCCRDFCVFFHTDSSGKSKETAFFTYLDVNTYGKYRYLFTKDPWEQYKTEDQVYIARLKDIFDELWKTFGDGHNIKTWIEKHIRENNLKILRKDECQCCN